MKALKIFALAVCYLMISIPLTSATNVNIVFNGQTVDNANLDTGELVSRQIDFIHNPSDFSWTNVRLSVLINGASLSHTVENVYLYVCGLDTPVDCIREQPEIYESFVDAELPWRDISEQAGPGFYPEIANLMFLIKMRDSEGNVIWTGFFDTMERTAFNQFNHFNFDLQNIDFLVRTQDLIEPTKTFINSRSMIPFNWATNVIFSGASLIFALGANNDEAEQNPPGFDGIVSSSNDVSEISKDFFVIFPNASSGTTNAITLNSNALFSCGNGIPETLLGETSENCCYDVGCGQNEFCDLSDTNDPSSGACQNEDAVSLSIIGSPIIDVSTCGQDQDAGITLRINNPPSNIPDVLNTVIIVDNQIQNINCNLVSGSDYNCPLTVTPQSVCGSGSEIIDLGNVSLTLSYNDGPVVVNKELSAEAPDITVNFDCSCESGFFCDSQTNSCESEDSVTLKIINVTSFIEDFNPAGDFVDIYATIENAPADLAVNTVVYNLGNITFDGNEVPGASGSITCAEVDINVFACSIPLSIPNYDSRVFYIIRDNSLEFSVSFSNDPEPIITKTLMTSFSDISVPSFYCGDRQVTSGETSENCCYDAGCGQNEFCDLSDPTDPASGTCKNLDSVSLSVISSPIVDVNVCDQDQDATITLRVNNPPSELADTVTGFILLNNVAQTVTCDLSGGFNYNCGISVLADAVCGSGSQVVTAENLTLTFTFNDGPDIVVRELSTNVPDVTVNFNCACDDGLYCDASARICNSQGAVTLNIINVTSFIESYDTGGDVIDIFARIDNSPSDMVVNSITYTLGNITSDSSVSDGVSGNVQCDNKGNNVYFCSIPFVLPNYNNTQFYSIEENSLEFSIGYSNEPGPIITQNLVSSFSDVSIPGFFCGDGIVNFGETSNSCCIDAGCPLSGEYCDRVLGCEPEPSISLNFVTAEPTVFTDCRESHEAKITSQILNPPSEFNLESFFFATGGETKGWNFDCEQTSPGSGNGIIECTLEIPPMEDCSFPQEIIDGNEINVTISFNNGTQDSPFFASIFKDLSVAVSDFSVSPVFNCGDNIAETEIGESASNCCVDVPCETAPEFGDSFYCDVSDANPNGTCLSKSDISLVVTSPKSTVVFDSCEVSNDVNVKAFIKNQPATLFVEEEFATLDGTSARDFFCRTEKRPGTKNVTFDCTLTVPPSEECTQGGVENFANNDVNFLVSFQNGVGNIVTQEISAALPDIKVTQKVRSLHDIFDELGAEIVKSTNEVRGIADDLLDFLKTCTDIAFIVAIVGISSTIFGGIYAGVSQGSVQSASQAFAGLGAASGSLTSAWTEMCRLVENQYQLAIKHEEMNIEMAKLESCIEVQQRQIDLGLCRQQEQNCFNEIVDCVDFGRVERQLRDVDSIVQSSADISKRIGRDLEDVGESLERADFLGRDRGSFSVFWDHQSTSRICEFDGKGTRTVSVLYPGAPSVTTRACDNSELRFEFRDFDRCDRVGGQHSVYLKETGDSFATNSRNQVNNVFTNGYNDYTFVAYCDRDLNNRFGGSDTTLGSYTVTYVKGNPFTCKCGGSGDEIINSQTSAVEAGPDQTVKPGEEVVLDGSSSPVLQNSNIAHASGLNIEPEDFGPTVSFSPVHFQDQSPNGGTNGQGGNTNGDDQNGAQVPTAPDYSGFEFNWKQMNGTNNVQLSATNEIKTTFTAPLVEDTLVFRFTVKVLSNGREFHDDVKVEVKEAAAPTPAVTGQSQATSRGFDGLLEGDKITQTNSGIIYTVTALPEGANRNIFYQIEGGTTGQESEFNLLKSLSPVTVTRSSGQTFTSGQVAEYLDLLESLSSSNQPPVIDVASSSPAVVDVWGSFLLTGVAIDPDGADDLNDAGFRWVAGNDDWVYSMNDENCVIEPGNDESKIFKCDAPGYSEAGEYTATFLAMDKAGHQVSKETTTIVTQSGNPANFDGLKVGDEILKTGTAGSSTWTVTGIDIQTGEISADWVTSSGSGSGTFPDEPTALGISPPDYNDIGVTRSSTGQTFTQSQISAYLEMAYGGN